jgi:hypothetical protein
MASDTEVYDDEGTCVLVKWPMNDYPDPKDSVTHGKARAQILKWVGKDDARALVVFREESDKFDDADVELLHALQSIIDAKAV